jgi:branched-chain amino acid transport system permease protein
MTARAVGMRGALTGGLVALTLAVLPAVANDYVLTVLVMAGIYAIIVIGLNVFTGFTGQISFGHNAFAAIGGYTSAILTTTYGWPPLAALPIGTMLAIATAVTVGYPTLKLRGHYLAMGTLALGLISYVLSVQLEGLTRGFTGIAGIPPLGAGAWVLTTPRHYFYAVAIVALAAVWGARRIVDSRLGLALRAIREGEDAARALGIDVPRHKVVALAASAAYAAVAGSLFGHFVSFISPEVFGIYMIVLLFTMLYVGGIGTTWGPVLGAVLIGALPEALSGFKDYRELVYAVALLAIVLFTPRGLGPLLARLRPARRPA